MFGLLMIMTALQLCVAAALLMSAAVIHPSSLLAENFYIICDVKIRDFRIRCGAFHLNYYVPCSLCSSFAFMLLL